MRTVVILVVQRGGKKGDLLALQSGALSSLTLDISIQVCPESEHLTKKRMVLINSYDSNYYVKIFCEMSREIF